jgi:hypothetical protein
MNHISSDINRNIYIIDKNNKNIIFDYKSKPKNESYLSKNSKACIINNKFSINHSKNSNINNTHVMKKNILINSNIDNNRYAKTDVHVKSHNNQNSKDKSFFKSDFTTTRKDINAISFKSIQIDKFNILNA